LQSLSDTYNEEFIGAAEGCGLLLNEEKMDAESSIAMWEEGRSKLQFVTTTNNIVSFSYFFWKKINCT
jgi:hypothetical protein